MNIILDEIGLDWVCRPLNYSNETSREWKETRWIVGSSMFFSIPVFWHLTNYLYVYKKEGYILFTDDNEKYIQIIMYNSGILITTSLISANYWRKATRGWRRNLDLLFAKFTFLTGCYYGFKYIKYSPYLIVTPFIFVLLLYVYGQSTKCVSENNPNWVKYHFTFHILLTIVVALLLDGIRLRINE